MNNSKYRFTLDMHSTISQVSLPVRENDAGIELRITLTDGGTPYHIADGCRAVFCARKSDDSCLLNDCIIEKNTTIYYKLTQQTTAAKGVVDCEIRVYGTEENLLTSPKFILNVSDRVWHDTDFPMSDSEKHAIDAIFAKETAREDAERQREIAEAEREVTYNEMLDTVSKASEVADTLTKKLETGDYNGQNGLTPFIGANGNWWIGDTDTGVLADGYSIPLREGSGKNSVEQIGCEAREENSVALGKGTIASSKAQMSAGIFNKENPDALFIVGNGTSKDNPSNAFEVLKDGTLVGDSLVKIITGFVSSSYEKAPDTGTYYRTIEIPFDFTPSALFLYYSGGSLKKSFASLQLTNGVLKQYVESSTEKPSVELYKYIAVGTEKKETEPLTVVNIVRRGGDLTQKFTSKSIAPVLSVVSHKPGNITYAAFYLDETFMYEDMIRTPADKNDFAKLGLSKANDNSLEEVGDFVVTTDYFSNPTFPAPIYLQAGKTYTFYQV